MDKARMELVKVETWQRSLLISMFANAHKSKTTSAFEPHQFDPFAEKPSDKPIRTISASRLADIMLGPEKPTE